jgi:hypothetical protein
MICEVPVQMFKGFDAALDECRLPLVTIFYSPEDYPDMWVARLFDIEKPTKYFALANSYRDIKTFKPQHMDVIQRDRRDVSSIVEVWI